MISRLGLLISRIFRRTFPDPFVLAILLTLLTALLALGFGEVPRAPGQPAFVALFDAWRSNAGLWKLLDFGMQMCLILVSGLVRQFANSLTALGPPSTVPLSSFLAACVINMFIPSGGGHWAVQGPVALEAGIQAGIAPGKMILSVAYGGEVTDMLQPFWALPLLAIVGVRARDIVGYTAIVMVFAGAWMLLGLVLF